ncbi:MAG: transcription termination/antitermination protein NusG, partial [Sulfobacillus sp.]
MLDAKARWYAVHILSGSEARAAKAIREKAREKGLEDQIEDILVPVEEVVEVKKGEKKTTERKFFPGYMLVKMILSDDTWHLVRNAPKVSGFLGDKGRPTPVSQTEVDRIMRQVQEGAGKPKHTVSFEIGEKVRVCDGPFSSFAGLVEEIDDEKARLKVSVSIFGR